MMFLLRAAFWLSIVLVLLPSGGSKPAPQASAESDISATEAVTAASATMSDMWQFCARQPDACVVGAQAAAAFGQRAQAGAKMVYEFVTEKMAQDTVATTASTGSSSVHGVKASADAARSSQNTLSPADLAPAFRGAPRKEPKRAA